MSEREQAIQIISVLPEYKISRILDFLRGIQFDDELEDDAFCARLYQQYLDDLDPHKHDAISIEELAAREGIEL